MQRGTTSKQRDQIEPNSANWANFSAFGLFLFSKNIAQIIWAQFVLKNWQKFT
jgi:hypothetical protein